MIKDAYNQGFNDALKAFEINSEASITKEVREVNYQAYTNKLRRIEKERFDKSVGQGMGGNERFV